MNYYRHHIGDYAQATAHLSFVEDAAYSRLLRKYYAEEKPLPVEISEVQRLVGARTRKEKTAIEKILREFFSLHDDGWHNKRADSELAEQFEADRERQEKLENERARQRQHREERRAMFAKLREKGVVPQWDTKTETLRAMLDDKSTSHAPVTVTGPVLDRPSHAPVTVTGALQVDTCHAYGHGYPLASTSTKEKEKTKARANGVANGNSTALASALARALKAKGVICNPLDPRLIALAKGGINAEQAAAAAEEARRAKGNGSRIPPGYALAILERWLAEPQRAPPVARDPDAVAREAINLLNQRDEQERST